MPPQVADTARASGCGKPGRAGEPGDHVVEPDAREDRHAVPGRLAVGGDLVAALGQLVAEQLGERVVGELGLLQADDVRPPLVQPRQQPRHALLDRVDVPGRDPHGLHGTEAAARRPARRLAVPVGGPEPSRQLAKRGVQPSSRLALAFEAPGTVVTRCGLVVDDVVDPRRALLERERGGAAASSRWMKKETPSPLPTIGNCACAPARRQHRSPGAHVLAARPRGAARPVIGAAGTVTLRDGEVSPSPASRSGTRIVEMDILADPERLRELDLTMLDD